MFSKMSTSVGSLRRKALLMGGVIGLTLMLAQPALAVAPDAHWCPGGGGCVTFETLQEAVDAAELAGVPGDIKADPGTFNEDVTAHGLKGVNFIGGPSGIKFNLTINNSKDITVTGFTVAGSTGISVNHDKGFLAFNNNTAPLIIQNSALKNLGGVGLTVLAHNGVIALNKVKASGSSAGGASLDNTAGSAGVLVVRSKFDKNKGTGLNILTDGPIHLSAVSASKNTGDGANLDNSTGVAAVLIDNAAGKNGFNQNTGDGLFVRSKAVIKVLATSAGKNGDFGATLINDTGSSDIAVGDFSATSKFDANTQAGLFVQTAGGVTLQKLTTNKNLDWGMTVLANKDIVVTDIAVNRNGSVGSGGGAILLNYTGPGNVVVNTAKQKMNHFDRNIGVSGLDILSGGTVTITDISASKNKNAKGLQLSAHGLVQILTSHVSRNHFDGNGQMGLLVTAYTGNVVVKNSTAIKNGVAGIDDGAQIDTTTGNGNATFTCGKYSKNTDNGIQALLGTGNLTLNGIVMAGNGGSNLNTSDPTPTIGTCP